MPPIFSPVTTKPFSFGIEVLHVPYIYDVDLVQSVCLALSIFCEKCAFVFCSFGHISFGHIRVTLSRRRDRTGTCMTNKTKLTEIFVGPERWLGPLSRISLWVTFRGRPGSAGRFFLT